MARPKTGRKERVFYIAMDQNERETTRDNMKRLRKEYKISMSEVLRKVMIEHMNDEEFLKFIGLID